MSWDSYVTTNLVGSGHVTKGAILGADGSVWASTVDFKGNEAAALANLYKNPASAFASGINLQGEKHMAIKADDSSIYGKKGNTGFSSAKTTQAIVVGLYDDKTQPGNNANVVEKLAAYLRENGY